MSSKPQEIKGIITESESRSLIEELLKISLHCIAFLRNIFDDKNFKDEYFVPNTSIRNTEKKVKIKKLIKGVSNEADVFQNWIDQGIVDAIRMKYLRAVQFSIYLEEDRPLDLTECYLFELNYIDDEISVSVNNKYENDFTTLGNREKVQQLIKRLIVLTQTFNPLPAKKFISIRLLFHDHCPKYYQPAFFKDASDMEPAKIELEKRNRGVIDEVGTIETGHDFVNIRILTNYGKLIKNPVKIDPFDLVCGEISFNHSNKVGNTTPEETETKLSLEKYLYSNKGGTSTQVVPSSLQFQNFNNNATIAECECGARSCSLITYIICNKCSRKVHAYCYGISPGNPLEKCYTCSASVFDSTITLMRIRFLWKYFTYYGMPPFLQLFKVFNLTQESNTKELKIILNRLFKDKIIINSGKPVLKKNGEFVFGCGYINPTFNGIIDDSGNELIAHKQYAIAFVPRVKAFIPNIDYSNLVKQIYFPKRIKNEAQVSEILHKFKHIIADDNTVVIQKVDSNKSIVYEGNESGFKNPIRAWTTDTSLTTDELDNLSFEDSLSFLSQSQFMSHETSTDDVGYCSKKRKISINCDRLS